MICFTVYGDAKPAGSKRGFARQRSDGSQFVSVVDANPKSRDWKNAVSSAAAEFFPGTLLDGPLSATFVFYQPRPKGHFGKSGLNSAGRAKPYPTGKPDVLKLARGVEDALSKVLYHDDSQIVMERIEKRYGEPARVEISLSQVLELDHT